MHGKKDLAVMSTGVVVWFDVNESELTAVKAAMKVFPSKRMAVIPARTLGLWSEVVSSMRVWRDGRATLLFCAVRIDWNRLAVPVDNLFVIGVVEHIDHYRNTFLHPQEGTGNLAVIANSVNSFAGSDFKGYGSDTEGEISLGLESLRGRKQLLRSMARSN